MSGQETDLLQWAAQQGVAVLVLVLVLLRLDTRLQAMQTSLDQLLAHLAGRALEK